MASLLLADVTSRCIPPYARYVNDAFKRPVFRNHDTQNGEELTDVFFRDEKIQSRANSKSDGKASDGFLFKDIGSEKSPKISKVNAFVSGTFTGEDLVAASVLAGDHGATGFTMKNGTMIATGRAEAMVKQKFQ